MINIPDTLTINGKTIKINYRKKPFYSKGTGKGKCLGIVNTSSNLITLARNDQNGQPYNHDNLFQVFIHELIHFMLVNSCKPELTNEETFTDEMSSMFHQVMNQLNERK